MKKILIAAILLCTVTLTRAQTASAPVGPSYSVACDPSPETNVVAYVFSYSSTNWTTANWPTGVTIISSTNSTVPQVNFSTLFGNAKSGDYTVWVQPMASNGLTSPLSTSASMNVYWFPAIKNLKIQKNP